MYTYSKNANCKVPNKNFVQSSLIQKILLRISAVLIQISTENYSVNSETLRQKQYHTNADIKIHMKEECRNRPIKFLFRTTLFRHIPGSFSYTFLFERLFEQMFIKCIRCTVSTYLLLLKFCTLQRISAIQMFGSYVFFSVTLNGIEKLAVY